MPRTFNRERFLFPERLRANRFRTAARPVDAFEQASQGTVIQAPNRQPEIQRPDGGNSLLSLARSLGVASEQVGQQVSRQADTFNELGQLEGARLAREQELEGNRQNFRQLTSRVRQEQGDSAARELMRMNPHVQKGFDQTRARSASLEFNARLQSSYTSNPEVSEGVYLHDLEVSDDRYQDWVKQFTNDFNESQGLTDIDPAALSTLIPSQQDTTSRVNLAHDELRSSRRLQAYENSVAEFVDNTVMDLNANADWLTGNDNLAPSVAAAMITQQLDESVSLGFGGSDLDKVYSNTIAMIISAAQVTANPALLQVAELIEVGRPEQRQLLLNTSRGAQFRTQLQQARANIVDREYQLEQRDRTQRDQRREDSMNDGLEVLAQSAALYQNMGRTPQARQMLEDIVNDVRVDAASNGWSKELNSVVGTILQEGVDNQGTPIVDYESIAAFEEAVITGTISGTAARSRAREMYQRGDFGDLESSAETYLRITQSIQADEDSNTNRFMSEADSAASEIGRVFAQRAGYVEDERGRLVSVKQTLMSEGFTEGQITNLMGMTSDELVAYQEANSDRYSTAAIQAMNLVVNEGLNPLESGTPYDPADSLREQTEFKNQVFRGLTQFREENGRDMTDIEMTQYIEEQQQAYLSGQRVRLSPRNPLSSVRESESLREQYNEQLFNETFEGISDTQANGANESIMDNFQLMSALNYYTETGQWHPEIVTAANNAGLSPMGLFSRQTELNGVEVDRDLFVAIGVQTPAQASANLPGSIYSINRDISSGFTPGSFEIATPNLLDNSPRGSYDFTLKQNGATDVNIPSPFDGVVTEVWNESNSGGYGNGIVIRDRQTGNQMFIAHMSGVYYQVGDRVLRGQAIGKQGSTGNSTGDHIHAEVLDSQGAIISDRNVTKPIIDSWFDYIEQGSFLPPNATTAGEVRTSSSNFNGVQLRPREQYVDGDASNARRVFSSAASRLGVTPDELAAVSFLESELGANQVGGDGDNYQGYFQFGPDERARYGVYATQPLELQMNALERFLADRGYEPGMGIGRLYSTILAGNPWGMDSQDSNGTSASNAVDSFRVGGFRNNIAREILGL